jgi:MFS transporter, AAHS family, 3-hydroxyphenylpropionic acid transporter
MTQSVPNTQTQWLEVIFLWLAGVSAAMQFAKLSVSYDAVMMHYQTGATLTGLTLSVVGIAGLIFGVFAGMIANRIGYLKVLVGALFLGGVLSFLQSLLPHFSLFLLTRLLEGFSQLGVVVAAPTLIAKLSAPQHRSLTMGLWGTFFGVAFAITGWLGKSALDQLGLHGLFLSHALLISGFGVVLHFLLRKNPVLDFVPVAGGQSRLLAQMLSIYRNPRSLYPSLVFVFYTCTLVSLLTYIPRFVENEAIRASMLVVLPLISTGGTFLAGALGQYFMRPQKVALIAYFGVAITALMLPFLITQTVFFSLVVAATTLCLGMIPGAALAMIPSLARNPVEQAQGYGLIAQFGNLGATLGPPTFAAVITGFGITGFSSLVLIICSCGVLFSYLASRIQQPS